jgi:hypothetical protein
VLQVEIERDVISHAGPSCHAALSHGTSPS